MSEELALTPPNSPGRPIIEVNDDNRKHKIHGIDNDITFNHIVSFRWFSCLGEAKLEKAIFSDDSYFKNNEMLLFESEQFTHQYCEHKRVHLFDNVWDFGSLFLYNVEMIFRMARSEFLFLQDAAITDFHTIADLHSTQDYIKARKQCVMMFLHLREYLIWAVLPKYNWILPNLITKLEDCLKGFRLFLQRITNLPEYILHHAAHSQGNKCVEASYHVFHGSLDLGWLHLTASYQLDECRRILALDLASDSQQADVGSSTSLTLDQSLRALVADLLQLALIRFEKIDIRTLLIRSPFSCSCVAELWVLLYLFTTKLCAKRSFDKLWSFVNKVLEDLLAGGQRNAIKISCVSIPQTVTQTCSNPQAFTLWFLKHSAMLFSQQNESTSSNYPLLENVLKGIISSDVSETNMRVYLGFIEKILIRYWEPKSEIIILLWEYFQKRLNSTFFVPGASVNSMAIMSESVSGMVKQVKSRLSSNSHCEDSFQMFLRILGLHLQRVSGQPQHWTQLRGRVYSKLSAAKVQALTEVGLYHLVSLFLTLALAVPSDIEQVCKKLQSLLNSVSEGSSSQLVWRSYLSMCLLSAERGLDFTPVLAPLTCSLQEAVSTPHHSQQHLVRTYIDGLKDILDASPCLKIDHNILIGNWIPKHLAECSLNDAVRLLEVLQLLISRVQKLPLEQVPFQNSLWQHLGPYLRQGVCEDGPLQLADVSLSLCLLSHGNCDTLRDILNLFINNNSANIGTVRRFLWQLVQQRELLNLMKNSSPGSPESQEVLIIKSWIHCSLVTVDWRSGSSELSRVTDYIAYLPSVAAVCMDLPSATDPLTHFIVAISNKYKAVKDIFEKGSLRQKMSSYFAGIEKWVEPHVRHPKSAEVTSRIYHVVGLIFSLLPSFIYVKSRPNTVLKGLLDVMFLPLNAYKPDFEPNPTIKTAIAANLHLYIKGLADLGKMQDSYIDRCVEDLVRVYLPWVAGGRCALLECVERLDRASSLLLSTVCTAFIKRKATSPHPHCPQALKFLSAIATTYSRECQVMLLLVDKCFEHVCDVIMFCDNFQPSKKLAQQFLVLVFESHSFGDELSNKIVHKFGNLCKDYLPFLPGKLFNLFQEVLQHRPELISRFLPILQNHVKIVEAKRGINYDHSLRVYFEKLEKALSCLRTGS